MSSHDRHLVSILLNFAREALSFVAEILNDEATRQAVRMVEDISEREEKQVRE
jgi:hypothetical protein